MEERIKVLDPRVQKLIRTYLEVFRELPPPASCHKLVKMVLKLKLEFVGHKIRRRPYPAPEEQADELERQIQECIDAGLVLEYKDGDYPQHCSPCSLVAKPGSTAKRLVVDYEDLNKKMLNDSGSIPNMDSTREKIASCCYKTKMDKRSGFWQVDLTPNAQELLAFITPRGGVFKWKVMPFGVANAETQKRPHNPTPTRGERRTRQDSETRACPKTTSKVHVVGLVQKSVDTTSDGEENKSMFQRGEVWSHQENASPQQARRQSSTRRMRRKIEGRTQDYATCEARIYMASKHQATTHKSAFSWAPPKPKEWSHQV